MDRHEENSAGVSSDNTQAEVDRFKESFKYYRSLKHCSLSDKVFDTERLGNCDSGSNWTRCTVDERNSTTKVLTDTDVTTVTHCMHGLKSPQEWKIYRFKFPQDLIFIENPFTTEGQRYWISKCFFDYPQKPHVTNMDNLQSQDTLVNNNGCAKLPPCWNEEEKSDFYKKLRWITFGYHHDWDTKVYSESAKCDFPSDLGKLTKYLSSTLGFDQFQAEAAIVNYYHLNSTLSGHQDRSERYQDAPLFSISFGQTALFLIGGDHKEVEPLAMYLKSGDIVIMSGRSRRSYHGVPRIIQTESTPWLLSSTKMSKSSPEATKDDSIPTKKSKFSESPPLSDSHNSRTSEFSEKEEFQSVLNKWDDFLQEYISRCRINLNVRQVLLPGEVRLPTSV